MARGSKQEIAAEQLRSAAEAGDPAAMWQYALAILRQPPPPPLSPGQNALPYLVRVTKAVRASGDVQARDLIARSATAGFPPALVVEAELAEQSDPDRTESLLRRAADQGDTAAMLYLAGLLALHDRAEAAQWFTRLAEEGDLAAMYRLADLLRSDGNTGAAQGWLVKAAEGGSTRAQGDLAVQSFENGDEQLDPGRPPAADPRRSGVFTPGTPTTRRERLVGDCAKCEQKTVQDHFELIVGKWFGLRGPGTAGKTGTRVNFSACTACGCLFPMDDQSRQYVRSKGGEFFNPARASRN
jgi:hypothetical protein